MKNIPTFEDRCSLGFEKLLANFPLANLDASNDSIFGLRSDFTIGYFNMGWVQFARDNGAPEELTSSRCLTTSAIEVCGESLAPFYTRFYTAALDINSGKPYPCQHQYECSSPEVYREFLMTAYPLGVKEGLLIVNSLVIAIDHADRNTRSCKASYADYRRDNGTIHQCSHCRKVENIRKTNRWDWVPAWVKRHPPETSHGLCPICLEHYYPDSKEE